MTKSVKEMLAAANAAIETLSVDEALKLIDDKNAIFVDVRDAAERDKGYIKGSAHVPRGFLEFQADPESPLHNAALRKDRKLVLYCASGGRSALGAKTLKDMGYEDVASMAGGFAAWTDKGGPTESD